ncbi:hypothetical protein [Actimicrobium antarcticum]|uniref:Uncharacterized protein n=1 Tax=Actimicrobium antarcticum TaxID=1051899 RepID=A0ABP7T3F1_9BURK
MLASAVFQRSDTGRSEIHQKTYGLTQTERMVLILVDGLTPLAETQEKLKGLSPERFERAFNQLKSKDLIVEVMLAPDVLQPDIVDPVAAARFLQQDPLDPVTIVSFDADSDFGMELYGERGMDRGVNAISGNAAAGPALTVNLLSAAVGVAPSLVSVDFHIPLKKQPQTTNVFRMDAGAETREVGLIGPKIPVKKRLYMPWGPLMMAAGCLLLAASVVLRLMR